MRHLEQRITCTDHTGKRYRVEVFVTSYLVTTLYGTCLVNGPEEYWLDTGDCYRPVHATETFAAFMIADNGQLLTLHRVGDVRQENSPYHEALLPGFDLAPGKWL